MRRGKHRDREPRAAMPIVSDKPLLHREELERALASLTTRSMTEEDWAKYGPRVEPMRKNRTGYQTGGRGA